LDLLNFEEPIVLPPQDVIDLLVQMSDFELGFQINLVVVFRAQTITRFGPVLAHHDDRRLNGGEAGKDQIQ
jgi:hypothetical protein